MASPIFISLALLSLLLPKGTFSTVFTLKNNCAYNIWPGISGKGFEPTGLELKPSASTPLNAPPRWSGRIWARLNCATDGAGKFLCVTGDCGTGRITCDGHSGAPPATLVEFTIADDHHMDFYDVSLVDGFNAPVSVTPTGGCKASSCPLDVNSVCPRELQFRAPDGTLAGCNSACTAFKTDRYCCKGAYNDPKQCTPTEYSKIFKDKCPLAYSYAYDDLTSTCTCSTGADYLITFCP